MSRVEREVDREIYAPNAESDVGKGTRWSRYGPFAGEIGTELGWSGVRVVPD